MDLTSSQCSADIGKLKAVEKVGEAGEAGEAGESLFLLPCAFWLIFRLG